MTRAVLSIGSNLGDRVALLGGAVAAFADVLVATSPVYETAPWGGVEQGPFLNAVLIVCGVETPADWLARAQDAETVAARRRPRRWGPRTLDVDLVTVTEDGVEVASDDPLLTLPHPRAAERAFVLAPWLDVQPAATLAGVAVAELLAALGLDGIARRDDLGIAP